jgi:hypothetical protein
MYTHCNASLRIDFNILEWYSLFNTLCPAFQEILSAWALLRSVPGP